MKILPDDWRLHGQEKYLSKVDICFKLYSERKNRPDWEHDHCEFCGETFSDTEPDSLIQGYATNDDYHWICENCYSDFKEMFQWNVIITKAP